MRTTAGTADTSSYPTPAVSVARMFCDRVAATPEAEAFRFPTNGGWASVSWRQTAETVRATAAGLLALGIQPEERVAIESATRIEWLYADLAIMCAGAATTAVYPSTGGEDVAFILSDSGSRIVFAEDDTQIAKLRAQRDHIPDVLRVVTFDGEADGGWVLSLQDLQALGAKHLVENPIAVDEAVAAVQPDQLATLIYTSGTTGRPKGVELPHRCWTYIGAGAEAIDIVSPSDLHYLWLPMSHSFGKMLEAVHLQIGFPTAVDGRMDKIVENLAVVRPTFMAGPPRIRARLGGRIRFLLSGSATLSKDVAAWFAAAGMPVLEGYALTETSAAGCIGRPEDPTLGLVGPPLVGTEIKIADDGEIFVRGPGVMRGYHNLPDATAAALDADGWLRTGDVGEIDEAGRLRITDRKKDLIKTSGGKYIAPQAIEGMFQAICPLASQMLVHCDGRNYATALITLDPEALAQWGRAQGLKATDYPVLAEDPTVHRYVQACVDELNGRLNRWETIKDFRILDHDLSVEEGELTPSMKVKRKFVEAKYESLLDSMYDDLPSRR